jgi:hypothetical protein
MEDFYKALEDIAVMEKKLQLDERFFNMTLIKKK